MNAPSKSLLWKEWREQRGTIAGLALASAVTLVVLSCTVADRAVDGLVTAASATLALIVPFGSLLVGAHAAAGEHSRRTIGFLQSLPVNMSRPAGAKLFWATIAVATPTATVLAAVWTWRLMAQGEVGWQQPPYVEPWARGLWGATGWYATHLVAGVVAGVSLMWWLAATGVNRSDEVRAAAVSFLVVALLWMAFVYVVGMVLDLSPWIIRIASAALPGGAATPLTSLGDSAAQLRLSWIARHGLPLAAAIASHALVVAFYVRRFGRSLSAPRTVEAAPREERSWLAPPHRSPAAAILWMQLRQSAPLAGLGAALILTIAAVVGASRFKNDGYGFTPMDIWWAAASAWMMIGLFVSIVAGIGLFMDDLRPGVHSFWRSRPIPVNQWFWLKFLTGLASTIALLIAAPLVATAVLLLFYDAADILPRERSRDLWGPLAAMLAVHGGAYCAGTAAMAIIRQPIAAAIVAALALVATIFAVEVVVSVADDYAHPSFLPVALVAITAIGGAVALAWAAIRRNWGWKG